MSDVARPAPSQTAISMARGWSGRDEQVGRAVPVTGAGRLGGEMCNFGVESYKPVLTEFVKAVTLAAATCTEAGRRHRHLRRGPGSRCPDGSSGRAPTRRTESRRVARSQGGDPASARPLACPGARIRARSRHPAHRHCPDLVGDRSARRHRGRKNRAELLSSEGNRQCRGATNNLPIRRIAAT